MPSSDMCMGGAGAPVMGRESLRDQHAGTVRDGRVKLVVVGGEVVVGVCATTCDALKAKRAANFKIVMVALVLASSDLV